MFTHFQAASTLRATGNRTWRIAAIPTLSVAVAQAFQAAFKQRKGSLKKQNRLMLI
ncbi:hypothetical protein [Kingella oralis]|uniref:hypothetical protein n=1 Tax=Kingella oralis TaxID=505 RepID=UPI0034E404C0